MHQPKNPPTHVVASCPARHRDLIPPRPSAPLPPRSPVSFQLACISPFPTRSQNLRSFHTLPTPLLSSHRLLSSPISRHRRSQTLPTHLRSPSLTRSRSTSRRLATSAGATRICPPGTHSGGRTDRATSASGGGRTARRRERRMAVSERARRRDTTVVLVRKMCRAIRSASEGRDGEVSRGGRMARACCSRARCTIGARERVRKWCDAYCSR